MVNFHVLCLCLASLSTAPVRAVFNTSVLLVSFDGFRYDFIHRNESWTPNLLRLKGRGSSPEHLRNVFPTKTYPNHHSIATGLYPETHGVLANSVFEQGFNSELTYDDPRLWHYDEEIEPIWVNEQIKRVDRTVGYLVDQIEKLDLTDKLNVIIVSDHGSHEAKFEHLIDLGYHVDMSALTWAGCSPILQIQPHKGREEEVFQNLTQAAESTNAFQVYRKEEIPEKWNYKRNNRTADLLALATVGYAFQGRIKHIDEDWKTQFYNVILKPGQTFGVHGYSNEEPSMRAFFLAWGPLIKEDFNPEPFDNVDIQPLISCMLQLPPMPQHLKANGTLANVASMFRNPPSQHCQLRNQEIDTK
ncbi:ectonucleotide pyrophosphatase/phosphodiesterase family member 5 isoform X2 [Bemisia tabaci]|uniref:ectonucleotide pyrophosphatase/phosphodiesterase family member 5 isoform X2 n=1 Tax=Bemisia tabaci TaxID=7038 RepID=UPI003B287B23